MTDHFTSGEDGELSGEFDVLTIEWIHYGVTRNGRTGAAGSCWQINDVQHPRSHHWVLNAYLQQEDDVDYHCCPP